MHSLDELLVRILTVLVVVMGFAVFVRECRESPETVDEWEVTPQLQVAPPVLVLYANGEQRCVCVPVPSGCYTAAHCFQALPYGAQMILNGRPVRAYSIDPTRDLAHIPAGANPNQRLGVPGHGEYGVWRGIRSGVGKVFRTGIVWGPYDFPHLHVHIQRQQFDLWQVGVDSVPAVRNAADPDVIFPGDSGAGFWIIGPEGPVLVGILSMSDGWGADTVRVP